MKKLTEGDLTELLADRHKGDLFVAGCKNGSTWSTRQLRILDAWVLKRTYSPLTTIGYEIKCSRNDFERDQKWVDYLDLCHEFYLVCPAGLIRSVDLPKGIGLIWTTMNGEKLLTKLRSDRREIDLEKLNNLMIYILMSRSVIVGDVNEANVKKIGSSDRLALLHKSVEEANKRQQLAYFIKGHVKEIYYQSVVRLAEADRKVLIVDEHVKRLAQLGITWDPEKTTWTSEQQVKDEIAKLAACVDDWTLNNLNNIGHQLCRYAEELRQTRDQLTKIDKKGVVK